MIQQHFGLKHLPLSKNNPAFFMEENFLQLKERFMSLVQTPGIGLLTGEPGVGKTAALRHIVNDLNPHQYQVFYLCETQFTSFDIYRQLAFQLGISPPHRFAQLFREIKNNIRERTEHKRTLPIFVFDEAQNLPPNFFRSFPSFLNFDFDAKNIMTVWFVGHPELATIINRSVYTSLSSRIHVRCHIKPFTDREAFTQLIQYAFKEAGAQSTLLSDSGIEILRVASQGRPRTAHNILACAMQMAVKKSLNHLPDDLLTEAIAQLKG
jgi:MSHA biogenesis protein MshM